MIRVNEDHSVSFDELLEQLEQDPSENALIICTHNISNSISDRWLHKWSKEQVQGLVMEEKVKNFLFLFPHKQIDVGLTYLLYSSVCKYSELESVSAYALDLAFDLGSRRSIDSIFRPKEILRPSFSGGDMQVARALLPVVGHLLCCTHTKAPTHYEFFAQMYHVPAHNAFKEYIKEYRASKLYSLFGEDIHSLLLYLQVTGKLRSEQKKKIVTMLRKIIRNRKSTT